MNNKETLTHFFGEQGTLSQSLPQYEHRREQTAMAQQIYESLMHERHFICEAGTGVGKSLSYLVPLLMWCRITQQRAVISTNTKSLQNQLMQKELPLLQELGYSFKYALAIGSGNYVCRKKLDQLKFAPPSLFEEHRQSLNSLFNWADDTRTGKKEEIVLSPFLWEEVNREIDMCSGKKCSFYEDCFYFNARKKWTSADIIVANHALTFTDIGLDYQYLPSYPVIIFDEAHNIPDVAQSILGYHFTNNSLPWYMKKFYVPGKKQGFLSRYRFSQDILRDMSEIQQKLLEQWEHFCDNLLELFTDPLRVNKIRLTSHNFLLDPLTELMEDFIKKIQALPQHYSPPTKEAEDQFLLEYECHLSRFQGLKNICSDYILHNNPEFIYWQEVQPKNIGYRLSGHITPLSIAPLLEKKVFSKKKSVVFTSATLSTGGDFEYFKRQVGLNQADELILYSPFDFKKQTILYIPRITTPDKNTFSDYEKDAQREIQHLLNLIGGRTLILFTNYKFLKKTYRVLKKKYSHLNILYQSGQTNQYLIQQLLNNPQTVILGTDTFWQGIDIQGDHLQSVIITKLPFSPPDEPIYEARAEQLQRNGISPFRALSLPAAIIQFKQGFGRLIRHRNDTGVITILDRRIQTKQYGSLFFESLAPVKITNTFDEVQAFYEKQVCS